MKRLLVCLLLCIGFALPALAQESAGQPQYTVQQGDNLWNLAGAKLENSILWVKILEENPFLKGKGRVFEKNGKVYVLIKPGESLVGLEKIGVLPTIAPIESLAMPPYPPVAIIETTPQWLWWVLAALAFLLLAIYLLRQMLNADPGTARSPVVRSRVTT